MKSNNHKIKAVIFDLDGLLIDSEPTWGREYDKFLANHKISDRESIRQKMRGRGMRENIKIMQEKLGLDGDKDLLLKEYREMVFSELLKKEDLLFSGAVDLLKAFKEGGLLIAAASGGYTQESAKEILSHVGILGYFSDVISSDVVTSGKPAPDVYLYTAKRLGVEPLNCLVLEDAPNGVVAAKAAGMRVTGVNKDPELREDLIEAGADKVYGSLEEIEV